MTVLYITLAIVIPVIIYECIRHRYERTGYYKSVGKPFHKMLGSGELRLEYKVSKILTQIPGIKAILYNCQIPVQGELPKKIDIIMLHTSGIYLFNIKKYNGWIFGTETEKSWTHASTGGHQKKFDNPLIQNIENLEAMKKILPKITDKAFRLFTVFIGQCDIAKLNLTTDTHTVLCAKDLSVTLYKTINKQLVSAKRIDTLYNKLYPLSRNSEAPQDESENDAESGEEAKRIPSAPEKSKKHINNIEEQPGTASDISQTGIAAASAQNPLLEEQDPKAALAEKIIKAESRKKR